LRLYRAVQALEYMGSGQAQAMLKRLADGVPDALLTREAKSSLQRLKKLV
jgi:hypothetical protein